MSGALTTAPEAAGDAGAAGAGPPPAGGRAGGGLATATLWSGAGVALSGLTRFAYSALVGHLGGAGSLSTVNSTISLALLAGLAGPNAAGSAAARALARARGAGQLAHGWVAWHRLVRAGAVLAALTAVVAVVVDLTAVGGGPVRAASLAVLVLALAACTLARGARFGLGHFARTALAEAAAAVVALVLLVVVLLAGASRVAVLPLAAGYATYAVLAWPRRGGAGDRAAAARVAAQTIGEVPDTRRELRDFLGWSVLGGLASAGLLQVSVVVAKAADTPAHADAYAAAVAVGTPMALLAVPLSQALFSLLARSAAGADAAGVRRRTDAATRALVLLMVPVGGGVVLVARTALAVVGHDTPDAVPLLRALGVAVLVSTLTVPAVASLTSGEATGARTVALMSGAGLLVGLAVMAVTVPAAGAGLGVRGVAAGYVAGTVVTNALPWVVAWRRHRLPWTGLTVRVVVALAVLLALLQLPQASGVLGGWVLGAVFAVAWLLSCLPLLRDLLRSARTRT